MSNVAACISKTQANIMNMSSADLDTKISAIKNYKQTPENDSFLMLVYMKRNCIYETTCYIKRLRNYIVDNCEIQNVHDLISLLKEYKPDGQGNYWEIDYGDIGGSGGGGGNSDLPDGCIWMLIIYVVIALIFYFIGKSCV